MRVAAIDMGTNSFLCLIAEVHGQKINVLEDSIDIVRLGEGLQTTGQFSADALARAEACLLEFSKKIKQQHCLSVKAVATSAARDAKNGQVLLDIGRRLSIPIEIIAGLREAELTFQGVLSGRSENNKFGVIDIGGGSTEFAYTEQGELGTDQGGLKKVSLNLGCVRLREKFLSVDINTTEQIKTFQNFVRDAIKNLKLPQAYQWVAVAGTPTTLASVKLGRDFDAQSVENSVLTVNDLKNCRERFLNTTLDQRKKIPGVDPKRADVILAGTLILEEIMSHMKLDSVTVSTRGVRYGLALELSAKEAV